MLDEQYKKEINWKKMNKKTFKSAWDSLEKNSSYPAKARKIITVDYKEFKQKVLDEDSDFVEETTSSLYNGDFYILKGAYTKEFMKNLKVKTFLHFKNKPLEFHKMLESCPDFHRKINPEDKQKYTELFQKVCFSNLSIQVISERFRMNLAFTFAMFTFMLLTIVPIL